MARPREGRAVEALPLTEQQRIILMLIISLQQHYTNLLFALHGVDAARGASRYQRMRAAVELSARGSGEQILAAASFVEETLHKEWEHFRTLQTVKRAPAETLPEPESEQPSAEQAEAQPPIQSVAKPEEDSKESQESAGDNLEL
jgi:hypothetical protein